MQQPHDIRNVIRILNQLGRTTIKAIRIDSNEIVDGELVDQRVESVVQNGVIETTETVYSRTLDCGHIAQVSSISATCDICSRRVCDACHSICRRCNRCVCRYCHRVDADDQGGEIYCKDCYMDVKAGRTAANVSRAVFGFIFKREGE